MGERESQATILCISSVAQGQSFQVNADYHGSAMRMWCTGLSRVRETQFRWRALWWAACVGHSQRVWLRRCDQ